MRIVPSKKIPNGWKTMKMGDLFDFKNGVNADKSSYGHGTRFINVMDVIKHNSLSAELIPGKVSVDAKTSEKNSVRYGDVLFNRTSETPEEIGLSSTYLDSEEVIFGGFVIRGRSKGKDLDDHFKKYCFLSSDTRSEIIKRGQGVVRSNIGQEDLRDIYLSFPVIDEQRSIVNILEAWDSAINYLKQKIQIKYQIRKGLMQGLHGKAIRVEGYEGKWESVKLGDIIEELSEKTLESDKYSIYSVTKNGILPQSSYFKKQIASSDNSGYKVIKKGNLVFSTMNLWMGSLDFFKDEVGIVSPAYKVFRVNKNIASIDFLDDFLKSSSMKFVYKSNSEQGASVVRRNLDLQGLLNFKVKIPSLEEQVKIANILTSSNKEIWQLEKKLKLLDSQRVFLVDNLISGNIRISEQVKSSK